MQKYLLFVLFFSFSFFVANAVAGTKADCPMRLKNKVLELHVIASNIANINTTRTPAGGPYKRQELQCKLNECQLIVHDDYFTEYLPDHPDADEVGLVKFPKISFEVEHKAIVTATRDYEEILTDCK